MYKFICIKFVLWYCTKKFLMFVWQIIILFIWKNFLQKEVILRIYWLNSFIIITNANKINVKKKNIYNMRNMYKNPQSVQYQ